jgi:16S rRNA C1402 (ribose-2'-O) methylase RsmI
VFVVVAVDAEQFPVAAIGGIVVVIMVFMMDGKLTKSLAFEFTSAASADRRKHFERFLAIAPHALFLFAPKLGDELTIAIARIV